MRIYELAKRINKSPKWLLQYLEELDIQFRHHMCTISNDEAQIIIEVFEEIENGNKKKRSYKGN